MPENPVGTEKQRKQVRRRFYDSDGHRIAAVSPNEVDTALDGLDIAEFMAEHGGHKAHCMGRAQPGLGLKCTCGWSEASAKWQDWKQGR